VSKKSILIENEYNDIKKLIKEFKKELYLQLIIEGVDDPGILKCVFMAGGPGSGKSFTAMELFGVDKKFKTSFAASGLKVVNSDSAFEKLLKDNGINPKDLGTIEKEDPELWDSIANSPTGIRSKAKSITKKQKDFYEAGRLGMIIDGTGDDYKKIAAQKKHAESLGYDCYMVFVNTSLEVALERNRGRERTLSDDLVQTIWKDVQQNMGRFQGLFGSSNFIIVDNTVYGPPAGEVKKAINRFVRQYTKNPIGKKWIDTARMLKNKNMIK
jgi:predicted kinase